MNYVRLATLLLMTALSGQTRSNTVPLHGWELLAPLPDSVGYGGMFAGVMQGQLVAGGGSQFRDKPNWLQGEKVFSDRIFTLSNVNARWREAATKLPAKMGHFATATTADTIYLVGGIGPSGCLSQAWQMRSEGGNFHFTPLPEFPHPSGYAAAAILRDRLYVVGGLTDPASKTPSVEAWSISLRETPGETTAHRWQREPDLPDAGVFVAAAASDGEAVYLIGGIGFDESGKAIPSARAFRLTAGGKNWERLPDLPGPRVGPASPCPLLPGKGIFVVGGYAEVFPGAPREHPGFSTQTLFFDVARRTWGNGPQLPQAPVINRDSPGDEGPASMISAPCAVWHDRVVVVGGEVRASVRTPAVLAWPFSSSAQ